MAMDSVHIEIGFLGMISGMISGMIEAVLFYRAV